MKRFKTIGYNILMQAQIIDLLKKLKRDRKMAILFIAHDLSRSVDDCLKIIKK